MSALDKKIFKKKKFSDLLEEIYNNQKAKQNQINVLIQELKPLINDIGDATLIVPLLKEYLDASIKNDDQLVKMATIIQRIFQNSGGSDSETITDAEKEELLKALEDFESNE
jgi:hypothetical protein